MSMNLCIVGILIGIICFIGSAIYTVTLQDTGIFGMVISLVIMLICSFGIGT